MWKYIIVYLSIGLIALLSTSCMVGTGQSFDVIAILRNPIIMGIILIAVLYFVFKSRKG